MRHSAGRLTAGAVCAALLLVPAGLATATPGVGQDFGFCPGPTPLVHDGTHWTQTRLTSGVTLATARSHNAKGPVEISVLRVKLRNHNVHTVALHSELTSGRHLSTFAHDRHFVAATNAMYFNTSYGAPKVPFVADRRAVVLSATPQPVAGIGVNHRAEAGNVWLHGAVRSGGLRVPLEAVNTPEVADGLTLYTSGWGPARIPLSSGSLTRTLRNGVIASGVHRTIHVPQDGSLLVARGALAKDYLESFRTGDPAHVSRHVDTDARVPFAQAYGTGTQVVKQRGNVENDLYCNPHEMYAARTTIGWNNAGSNLMLVTVESPDGPDFHGADENQMSALLVSLGATRAFALDGGGSTELLARLPTVHRMKIRSHVKARHGRRRVKVKVRARKTWDLHAIAHGYTERRIPVGIGIYSRRVHRNGRWHTVK